MLDGRLRPHGLGRDEGRSGLFSALSLLYMDRAWCHLTIWKSCSGFSSMWVIRVASVGVSRRRLPSILVWLSRAAVSCLMSILCYSGSGSSLEQ